MKKHYGKSAGYFRLRRIFSTHFPLLLVAFSLGLIFLSRFIQRPGQSLRSINQLEKVVKVAFAITITKDGPFQDGAAVLAYSIVRSSRLESYRYSLIAFVHPSVVVARQMLYRLGYHVIESPLPVNISAIDGPFLREKINKNGCCGASELIKLNAYRLTNYDWVVHLDADTMIINPLSELFSHSNVSLIYTTDPGMVKPDARASHMPVQGGFLVIRPNIQDYRSLVNTVMTTEFYNGGAWNKSGIGWYWGGMTIQGLLPYYYQFVSAPNRWLKVDRCYYNTMADSPECQAVKSTDFIKSAHFTICQKPWTCSIGSVGIELCDKLHKKWFELRLEAEKFYGIPLINNPCVHSGESGYVSMALANASFPSLSDELSGFRRDNSPQLLVPTSESRYTSNRYDNILGGHYEIDKS
eukprot:gene17250-22779_t